MPVTLRYAYKPCKMLVLLFDFGRFNSMSAKILFGPENLLVN